MLLSVTSYVFLLISKQSWGTCRAVVTLLSITIYWSIAEDLLAVCTRPCSASNHIACSGEESTARLNCSMCNCWCATVGGRDETQEIHLLWPITLKELDDAEQ